MRTSIHSEFTGSARHSRTQWFYGLFRDLPGDRLSCHRRLAKAGAWRPVGLNAPPQDLTPAPRRQDHTTSPYAAVSAKGFDRFGTRPPKL